MNRNGIFTVATIAGLLMALSPGNLNAQQDTLKAQLVGTWRKIANPKGFLMLDAGGRYAQVIARTDRPKFKSPGQPTAEELAAATDDFSMPTPAHGGSARRRSFLSKMLRRH